MDSEGVFLNYAGYIISAEIFFCAGDGNIEVNR